MSTSTVMLAVGLVRCWVSLYTMGLPAAVKWSRRAEIESDLWEQARLASMQGEPPADTASHMFMRLLLGMPADIVWRMQPSRSAREERRTQVHDTWTRRFFLLLGAAVALLPLGLITFAFVTDPSGQGPGSLAEALLVVGGPIVAGAAMLTGFLIISTKPQVGLWLVALGALAVCALWYWMLVITLPIAVALIAIAYFCSRGTRWPRNTSPHQ